MSATTRRHGQHACDRCLELFGSVRGLRSHERAHDREDGARIRELADLAVCRVRNYARIDNLAEAIAYQVEEASRSSAGYVLDAEPLRREAEILALNSLRRHPITESATRAVLAWQQA